MTQSKLESGIETLFNIGSSCVLREVRNHVGVSTMAEEERLAFVERRDGLAGAIAFAKQSMRQYRKAVLTSRKRGFSRPSHASLPEYRRSFIESYLAFKQYIARNNVS